ncbi:extracellular solute-binding protein [Paenibacillus psychroresistens]|uniref:Extracellular solute-binding protein n=1 Tax=Paenibacillus psychroresistens TaxID=1778678 RepID=A0A6B8RPX8_9BACL|nr:extracellular solute-binding protein [Paenibacillus psychroresistens]QGQ98420.1 extracellular solute-binding protein [Paenibacillus psychroresistens]
MKSIKNWLGLAIVISMVTLSACSSNSGTKVSPDVSSAASSAASATPTSSEVPTAPVKFSFLTTDSNQPIPGGNPMDDSTIKYLAEKTNTIVDITFLPHGQADNLMKVKFASGELPDVLSGYGVNGELFINNQLIPLDDYIEKYGQNLKKVIPKAAWDEVSRNGKIYAIPESALGDSPVNRMFYVRKDWMDKVGIKEMPKTPDEFYNMLIAFRDKDPNGNNKKDEIPLSARENFTWLDNVLGMFGTSVFGAALENGEIVPRNTSKQMRDALSFVKKLMDEKLLDSEFMTNKRNTWEQKIQNDQVGVWSHAPNLAWDWQDKLNKALPGKGAIVGPLLTPKAAGVEYAGFGAGPINKAFSITKKAKDPAAIVKFFDWLVTQEGQEFVNFGVPGITYTKEGDKINYNKQKDTDDKSILWRSLTFNLAGWNPSLQKVVFGDEAVAKMEEFYTIGKQEGLPNLMVGAPTFKSNLPEIGEFGTAGTMFVETAAKIVLGDKPIEYYDEYVKNWRTRGGNDLVKQATDWYNANGKK